jgi:hypothetical protein
MNAQDLTAQSRENWDEKQRAKEPAEAAWAGNREMAARNTHFSP